MARRRRGRHRAEKKVSLLREMPVLVAIALLLALLVKTFFVQAFFIPSASMENTLKIRDRVIVDKFSKRLDRPIARGQIVVFRDPGGWLAEQPSQPSKNPVVRVMKRGLIFLGLLPSDNEQDLIKRVIGVGGDEVRCCDSRGQVTVNGIALSESYVFPNNPPSTQQFDIRVPKDHLWVMGDHRSASADSRAHIANADQGTVPVADVVGRAFVILWPADHMSWLKVPTTFRLRNLGERAAGGGIGGGAPSGVAALGAGVCVPLAVLRRRVRRTRRRVGPSWLKRTRPFPRRRRRSGSSARCSGNCRSSSGSHSSSHY